jgi:hypothetical protein
MRPLDYQKSSMRRTTEQLSLFPPAMASRPVTVADLELHFRKFKLELLKEISFLVTDQPKAPPVKWLKNKAAAALLGVSLRTLQDLRDKGIVPHSRIGRIIYYDPLDIQQEIERRKGRGRSHPETNRTSSCAKPPGRRHAQPTYRAKHPLSGR